MRSRFPLSSPPMSDGLALYLEMGGLVLFVFVLGWIFKKWENHKDEDR